MDNKPSYPIPLKLVALVSRIIYLILGTQNFDKAILLTLAIAKIFAVLFCRPEARGQRPEARGQRPEARGQRPEQPQ
jgi:hypothetical protein